MRPAATRLLFRAPYALMSRFRLLFYRMMGMGIGSQCRLERIRVRQPARITLGSQNALTEG